MHDAMGAQIASLATELSATRATEGELRQELRRALRKRRASALGPIILQYCIYIMIII